MLDLDNMEVNMRQAGVAPDIWIKSGTIVKAEGGDIQSTGEQTMLQIH